MKYKILMVSPIFFINICKYGLDKARVIENVLPDDAKFVRSFCDDHSGWGRVGLVIESDTFDNLNEGDSIPILPDPAFEKIL